MKSPEIRFVILAAFCVAGCDGAIPGTTGPGKSGISGGGTVRNTGGPGTAQVMGASIEVEDPGGTQGGLTIKSDSSALHGTISTADIRLGTFQIQLQQKTHDSMTLSINGSNYGLLRTGDRVFIDLTGVVSVNTVARAASGQP